MPKDAPSLRPIIYVMGPSGAGKDAVLAYARAKIEPSRKILFAHRYITRPADVGGENHVALSETEFAARRAAGLFAFDWQAHGVSYGIGSEIEAWRQAGFVVVVSGSREHFRTLDAASADIRGVLITASPELLRERLVRRGRDGSASVEERLRRASAHEITDPSVTIIDNSGALAEAGDKLVRVLLDAA